MESLYYSIYRENVWVNSYEFQRRMLEVITEERTYDCSSYYEAYDSYSNSYIEHYLPYCDYICENLVNLIQNQYSDYFNSYIAYNFNILNNPPKEIIFRGDRCTQVSNISTLPTAENTTNIDTRSDSQYLDNVISYNDIDYNSNDLMSELNNKRSLQLTSQVVDTYIQKSQYIYNNFTNKIVSINDTDYDNFKIYCEHVHSEVSQFKKTTDLPPNILVECEANSEYIWRSDESLKNMYNLPMMLVSYTKSTGEFALECKYNGFNELDGQITLYNYDDEFKYSSARSFPLSAFKMLLSNSQNNYVENILRDQKYSNINKYYFYIVNLTTEFIHFKHITEYNFHEDISIILPQYTLVVFNEAITTNVVMNKSDVVNEFIRAWKIKNKLYTVDDVKRLVSNIKEDYKEYSLSMVDSAISYCANIDLTI